MYDIKKHYHQQKGHHTHAWASDPHTHLARMICRREECEGLPEHDIHVGKKE